jgi:hypothetical protein
VAIVFCISADFPCGGTDYLLSKNHNMLFNRVLLSAEVL